MSKDNYTQHTLLGTADAMVWAEEFCRIFDGKTIRTEDINTFSDPVTVGTMVGWFANAMQTALNLDKARRREVKEKELLGGEPS